MDGGIPMRTIFRRSASTEPRTLDLYEIAYLAGGPLRVAETALITLHERGIVTVQRSRVRAGKTRADHPVERALTELCPYRKRVRFVLTMLLSGPETEEIGRRLVSYGLLTRSRQRFTAAGRRHVQTAKEDGALPVHVFDGPAALPDPVLRRTVRDAIPIPSGLGRRLIRMGRALDSDYDSDYGSDFGSHGGGDSGAGHHSCGGGGGSDY